MPSKTALVPTEHAKSFMEHRESHGVRGTLKRTQVSHKPRLSCRFCCWYWEATSHLVFCIATSGHCNMAGETRNGNPALHSICAKNRPSTRLLPEPHCVKLLITVCISSSVFTCSFSAKSQPKWTQRILAERLQCPLQDCTAHTGSLAGNPTKRAWARCLSL